MSNPHPPVVFVPARSPRTEVILNWIGTPEEKFEFYAKAFLQAARDLAERYDGTGPDRDFAAFPVVFMYRQALELYLKGFLLVGDGLLAIRSQERINRPEMFSTHGLSRLVPELAKVLNTMEWDWDFGANAPSTRDELERLLEELDSVDPRFDAFRYPVTKKGAATLPDQFRFDLAAFREAIEPLCETLDGMITGAEESLNTELEIRHDSEP